MDDLDWRTAVHSLCRFASGIHPYRKSRLCDRQQCFARNRRISTVDRTRFHYDRLSPAATTRTNDWYILDYFQVGYGVPLLGKTRLSDILLQLGGLFGINDLLWPQFPLNFGYRFRFDIHCLHVHHGCRLRLLTWASQAIQCYS